jgi:acyl-CoA synthetase (AMP-forming)/AMP-acid ligase II
MGPGYFVIAILGCADGGSACTPVATLQTRYESVAQCSAATAGALENNSNFDYPTLVARCRAGHSDDRAEARPDKPPLVGARRG